MSKLFGKKKTPVAKETTRPVYKDLWVHIILLGGGVLMVFPFIWQLIMSLMTNAEIQSVPPTFWPAELQWHNYADVFATIPFLSQFWVSILITVLRTVVQLVLCSLAGYAFARMVFPGRALLLGIVLSILMIPSQVYLLPQYEIISGLGLLETPWGIVLPGFFSAFGTFLMRQFFVSLPREFEEAARLDGANSFQIFWKVMLPLATPALSAVAITTVLWSWNDLLWPLIVTTQDHSMPLSVGIATFAGRTATDYSVMMAASVMAVAPVLIMFILLQRRVIEGLSHTGLK
ncbi:ABC transporter, permease protein [Gleimia coleocanis DSM 15436]|uniref:ABC transporter, permease protein n=1 Tax=Gleimia coleocanis DSM 15436 TaxID=525245 RepID=C0VZG1_9ACTO|nr:carbohydrate ABC transporter permease [Gleimia coleocanis]EEH64262.1 ABC transporter, permease protein [Gleimia coleocanis DSM 15436]